MTKSVNICFQCEDCGVKRSESGIVEIEPLDYSTDYGKKYLCRSCHMERRTYKRFMLRENQSCFGDGYDNDKQFCRDCNDVSLCNSENP